jgi:hypothetical protein
LDALSKNNVPVRQTDGPQKKKKKKLKKVSVPSELSSAFPKPNPLVEVGLFCFRHVVTYGDPPEAGRYLLCSRGRVC